MPQPGTWAGLPNGSHICLHFADDQARQDALTGFFSAGIEEGQKLIYVAGPGRGGDAGRYLSAKYDVPALLASGQLLQLDAEDAYLKAGHFDRQRCTRALYGLSKPVQGQSHTGVRVYGDNDWLLPLLDDRNEWLGYELQVGHIAPALPFVGMCGFDQRAHIGLDRAAIDAVHQHSLGTTPRLSPYWLYGTTDHATALAGKLDGPVADQALELMLRAVAVSPSAIVDLGELVFIDAAGTTALLRVALSTKALTFRNVPLVMAKIWAALGYARYRPLERPPSLAQ